MTNNDNKRYYWIKLKEDFFQSYKMRALESMENGMLYELIYLKLLTESITHEGELRFSKTIPYSPKVLAGVLNVNVDNLKAAIQVLKELELIEELDDGTLFMQEVRKLIGSETEWAEKKRIYRENHNNKTLTDNERTKKDIVRQENRDKSIEYREEKEREKGDTPSVEPLSGETVTCEEGVGDIYDTLNQYFPNHNEAWERTIQEYIGVIDTSKIITLIMQTADVSGNLSYLRNGLDKERDRPIKNKVHEAYIKDVEIKVKKHNGINKMDEMVERTKEMLSKKGVDIVYDSRRSITDGKSDKSLLSINSTA